MGLDMFLFAKVNQAGDSTLPAVDGEREVAYWRKANQIHSWFVDNVQGGVDECQESPVTRAQLETLRQLCMEALDTKNPNLLAPRAGFFFGSTEIDEYYWEDLRDTIDQLDKVLALPEYIDLVYQSSW